MDPRGVLQGRISPVLKRILRTAAALAFVAGILAANAEPTRAASWGRIGSWSAQASICTLNAGQRELHVAVPKVLSVNRTTGTGNDKQNVRYWTRLVNLSGVPLTDYFFGGQGVSYDNKYAVLPCSNTWGGIATRTVWGPLSGFVRVQYLVAWYDLSWANIGWTEGIGMAYNVYLNGYIGSQNYC